MVNFKGWTDSITRASSNALEIRLFYWRNSFRREIIFKQNRQIVWQRNQNRSLLALNWISPKMAFKSNWIRSNQSAPNDESQSSLITTTERRADWPLYSTCTLHSPSMTTHVSVESTTLVVCWSGGFLASPIRPNWSWMPYFLYPNSFEYWLWRGSTRRRCWPFLGIPDAAWRIPVEMDWRRRRY